ncbi:uncharacterized protein LOC122528826 [Frieseomelitta varia]|uniref:uncharacterized protein LOC122528826 n=1 Tax=Frieseomelitta varia TaxID=561572 RepID=UPI001CB68CDE|nr:uncharacterized protein LOC122528826 [Frieseomelitta varia]
MDRTGQISAEPLTDQPLCSSPESMTKINVIDDKPGYVELGHVHTHESVYAELTLTNESLLIQEYAFIDLSSSMEIQPNHGFGAILPGETIKLHLIYSPCLTDIPGNEIRANGLNGERSFQVQVVTLAELAGDKSQTILNKLKDEINTQSIIPRSRGFPYPIPVNIKRPKVLRRTIDKNEDDLEMQLNNDTVINRGDENDKHVSIENSDHVDRRKEKNSLEIHTYIIDTFCELSEQIIEFHPTACGSFSMASVHLRGYNMASYPHCTCGMIKNQRKEFTARYQFKSSSDRIKIMPQSGVLNNNELIEVNFMFKPRLPKSVIFEEGLRLKMNDEEKRETKNEKVNKPTKNAKKKKGKKEKEEEGKVSDVDKLAGEISLLESFEPCISTIFVTCTIDLEETRNKRKHEELLFVKLICPITRPEILVLNEVREIAFGPTAIGTSSRKFLFVKNISNQSVKINVNLLDPFGPFFVPPGRTIETGSILKLPVTYQPRENHEEEVSHLHI